MTPPQGASIAVKLPLAAGALILFMTAGLVGAAYLTLRATTTSIASNRLASLSEYFGDQYGSAQDGYATQLREFGLNDSLTDFLANPTVANRQRAESLIMRHSGRGRGNIGGYAVQVRGPRGEVLLAAGIGARSLADHLANDSFPQPTPPDSQSVGKLRVVNDTLVYPVVVRIGDDEPIRYLVQWRQVTTTARMSDLLGKILGSEGAMYFANADGSVWTDFGSITAAPLDAPAELAGNLRYHRAAPRGEVFASAHPIPNTPWVWTVEFPASSILETSEIFLRRLAITAALFVLATLLVAWYLSRQITRPLRELTDAADALAAGEHGRRLQTDRGDEIGHLGLAFNAMASQVEESHHRLEEKVLQRTEALNQALAQLHDAQETLMRRQKLALLGQLASGVGHELRNPLGVMSNAIYYLQAVQKDAPDDVREYLGILQQQVALSGKIVSDLLDLSRVSTVQRQAVTLKSLAETQLGRIPELRRIRVEQDFPEELPMAAVDPVHAGQVVFNLITNAVQAMGDAGGTLTLRGRHVADGTLRFEVGDTGPGVSAEVAQKIFEPLYTTKARGIGLGLAVSRSLAEANGGSLALEQGTGPGATFVFIMPAADATP